MLSLAVICALPCFFFYILSQGIKFVPILSKFYLDTVEVNFSFYLLNTLKFHHGKMLVLEQKTKASYGKQEKFDILVLACLRAMLSLLDVLSGTRLWRQSMFFDAVSVSSYSG